MVPFNAQVYAALIDVSILIPRMLAEFVARNRSFKEARAANSRHSTLGQIFALLRHGR